MPFGFGLALVGCLLPAMMVTSGGETIAEATVVDAAVGSEVALLATEARDALGVSAYEFGVQPWAIALLVLVIAGGVIVASDTRRAGLPISFAVGAVVAWALMGRQVSDDLEPMLRNEALLEQAGGSFVILVGLWLAVVLAIVCVLEPVGPGFVTIQALLLVVLLVAGASGLGSPRENLVDPGWAVGSGAAVAAIVLSLISLGFVKLLRARRAVS